MHQSRNASAIRIAMICCTIGVLNGCVDQTPTDTGNGSAASESSSAKSNWHDANGSPIAVVPMEPDDAQMQAAIAEARRTAEEARLRWTATDEAARSHWGIKWAAATIAGEVEHVWVMPLNWSPFRVEGVLLSEPTQPLAAGKVAGEIVNFPIEELTDWVDDSPASETPSPAPATAPPNRGGYTIKVLEERFGKP